MNDKIEKNIMNCIDLFTDKLTNILKKIGKNISNRKTHDTVYIFNKIIVTLAFLFIAKIAFDLIGIIGHNAIYLTGKTFRGILDIILNITINLSYFIFCFLVLLKVFESIFKNKELNLIENDRRKDTKLKKKMFSPIIDIIKSILEILTIPFILVIVICSIALGMNFALLVHGYLIFGPILIFIGLGIMCLSVVLLIKHIVRGGK
ncbi:MAG: hypothetical protein PUD59_05220 [bacterium]|nr:hypothetical protein [bacterium]